MKKIKIKICKYDEKDKFSYGYFILRILKKYYDVELSDQPDYIFYNESTFEYLNYDCIRIFFTGENVSPDFNFCDYAIGFDYLNFGDRYFRLPLYLVVNFYSEEETRTLGDNYLSQKVIYSMNDLKKKTGFCGFVYSNYLADNARAEMFNKLSEYKQISSGGAYLNNTGGRIKNKLEFDRINKFSIAFENTSRSGYTTEKIISPLMAGSIPIYWGNVDIDKEFNTRRFINCHEFTSLDDVVKRVKEIDSDDQLYLSMVNEPIWAPGYDYKKVLDQFEKYLCNIFDQPVGSSRRRTRNSVRIKNLENNEIIISKYVYLISSVKRFFAYLYKPFKKIKFFEVIKHNFFRKIKAGK